MAPPYNIERLSDNDYRISMAVAGFGRDDVKIEVKEQTLLVRGEKKPEAEAEGRQYLHRGIAQRAFERRFQLADHVEVRGADLKDGLLHIELQRNIPERMKPRTIAIGVNETPKQIPAARLIPIGHRQQKRGETRLGLAPLRFCSPAE